MTKHDQIWATGRRKTSVAQVRLIPDGAGKVTVNATPAEDYFKGQERRLRDVMAPIGVAAEAAKKYDYAVKIVGGGLTRPTRPATPSPGRWSSSTKRTRRRCAPTAS